MRRPTAAARKKWHCLIAGCPAWGYLDPQEDGALAVIAHNNAQHPQPSEDSHA